LPTPTAIFDINFFRQKPEPFFNLAKELFPGQFAPTFAHCFFKVLHSKGYLMRNYTQNIDALERVAGMPADAIVEVASYCSGSLFSLIMLLTLWVFRLMEALRWASA